MAKIFTWLNILCNVFTMFDYWTYILSGMKYIFTTLSNKLVSKTSLMIYNSSFSHARILPQKKGCRNIPLRFLTENLTYIKVSNDTMSSFVGYFQSILNHDHFCHCIAYCSNVNCFEITQVRYFCIFRINQQ